MSLVVEGEMDAACLSATTNSSEPRIYTFLGTMGPIETPEDVNGPSREHVHTLHIQFCAHPCAPNTSVESSGVHDPNRDSLGSKAFPQPSEFNKIFFFLVIRVKQGIPWQSSGYNLVLSLWEPRFDPWLWN